MSIGYTNNQNYVKYHMMNKCRIGSMTQVVKDRT